MNAIELLKEARNELGAVQYYIPSADETVEMTYAIVADVAACQRLAGKIDAYLASPAPDVRGLVEKIRGFSACILQRKPSMRTDNDPGEVEKISTDWMLSEADAAALIESYGRVVPRAMLDEIWLIGNRSKPGQKDIDTAMITAYSRTVPRCYEEKNRCNDCPADYPDKECPSYPEAQGNCEWEESEEAGAWEGSCGIFWTFPNDVSPEENGVAFCPMCGRRVKITRLGYHAE